MEAGENCLGRHIDLQMRVRDTATGAVEEVGESLPLVTTLPTIGAISRDGRMVAYPANTTQIRVVEVETGNTVDVIGGQFQSIALNHDGTLLLSGGANPIVDTVPFDLDARVIYPGHRDFHSHAAFTSQRTAAFSSGADGTIRRWLVESAREVDTVFAGLDSAPEYLSPSANDEVLLASTGGPVARLYDVRSPFAAEVDVGPAGSELGLYGADVSSRGDLFWAKARTDSWSISPSLAGQGRAPTVERTHAEWGPTNGAAFSHDATVIALAWHRGLEIVSFRSFRTTDVVAQPWPVESGVAPGSYLRFSRDGTLLAAANQGTLGPGDIYLFDTATLETIEVISAVLPGGLSAMDLSDDGLMVAVGDHGGRVRVWSVPDQRLVHAFDMTATVQELEFVFGDRHLAVSLDDFVEYRMTLDADELLEIARSRLTRGFNTAECVKYRLDPCPTLEDLQGG